MIVIWNIVQIVDIGIGKTIEENNKKLEKMWTQQLKLDRESSSQLPGFVLSGSSRELIHEVNKNNNTWNSPKDGGSTAL